MRIAKLYICLFTIFLSSCDYSRSYEKYNYVRINAMPVIIDEIYAIQSFFDGEGNDIKKNQLCNLVFNEMNNQDKKNQLNLSVYNVNKEKANQNFIHIARNGNDVQKISTACAAYISSIIYTIPDINLFILNKRRKASEMVKLDEKAIINLIPLRLAISRVNAEIFSSIAQQLANEKNATMDNYRAKIRLLFEQQSLNYLERLKNYYNQESMNKFQLLIFKKGRLIFNNNKGYLFDASNGSVDLLWYGTPWFSQGKLMGNQYNIYLRDN
ncbi:MULTISPECIES: hypothetical protein [Arsenophonus]|uniref:hypothetical protein n=1 Tax=Arsenophonus TaxID=637 RepID=UPI0015D79ACC|nr:MULTISPECIES: hypothetical protein [Arsenophonus]UBX30969.1 hypothetical protein LDL57_17630 [Arsenophonus apicola]